MAMRLVAPPCLELASVVASTGFFLVHTCNTDSMSYHVGMHIMLLWTIVYCGLVLYLMSATLRAFVQRHGAPI